MDRRCRHGTEVRRTGRLGGLLMLLVGLNLCFTDSVDAQAEVEVRRIGFRSYRCVAQEGGALAFDEEYGTSSTVNLSHTFDGRTTSGSFQLTAPSSFVAEYSSGGGTRSIRSSGAITFSVTGSATISVSDGPLDGGSISTVGCPQINGTQRWQGQWNDGAGSTPGGSISLSVDATCNEVFGVDVAGDTISEWPGRCFPQPGQQPTFLEFGQAAIGFTASAGTNRFGGMFWAVYEVPAVITAISPPQGDVGRQVTATISGALVEDIVSADFGPGIDVEVNQSGSRRTLLLAIADDAAPGPRSFSITTEQGSIDSGAVQFTVAADAALPRIILSDRRVDLETNALGESATERITLRNGGTMPLNWNATVATDSGIAWLSVAPTSGRLNGNGSVQLTIRGDPSDLATLDDAGEITIRSAEAGNSPQQVDVSIAIDCSADAVLSGRLPVCERDTLRIRAETPSAGTEVEEESELSFRATADYDLSSAADALLDLRLVDQNDNLIGASSFVTVRRTDGASSRALVIPVVRIPENATTLRLFARLTRNGAILAESTALTYPVVPPRSVRFSSATSVEAATDLPIDLEVRDDEGMLVSNFNGDVEIEVGSATTPDLAALRLPSASSATQTELTVRMNGGRGRIFLQTPEDQLTENSTIDPDTPLEGTVELEGKVAGSKLTSTHRIDVESPLDLSISQIRVQQAVNLPDPNPLVAAKELVVRLLVNANTTAFDDYAKIEGITATVDVIDGRGDHVAGSPFTADSGAFMLGRRSPTEPFIFERAPDPSQLPKLAETGALTLNIVVPAVDYPGDAASIRAELDDVIPNKTPGNDSASANFAVRSARQARILYRQARYSGLFASTNYPGAQGIPDSIRFAKLAYPVGDLLGMRFIPGPDVVVNTWPPPVTIIASWINSTLFGYRVDATVLFVDQNFFRVARGRTGLSGTSFTKHPLVFVASPLCALDDRCGTLSHELGHQFGLEDSYNLASGVAGNRVETDSFDRFDGRFVQPGDGIVDFMGNRPGSWVDGAAWRALRTTLAKAAPRSVTAGVTTAAGVVFVEGTILANGSGTIDRCYGVLGDYPADPAGSGSYTVETLGADGTPLASVAFEPSFVMFDDDELAELTPYAVTLPFGNDVQRIRLLSGGQVIAEHEMTATAPSVTLDPLPTTPLDGMQGVTWSGADVDGDNLTYSLFYSPDGQLQIPLVLEGSGTSFEWNTDLAPSGPAPMLTLIANDGGRAVMEHSEPLVVENRMPTLTTAAPKNGERFEVGDEVVFKAAFFDPEDGFAVAPKIEWRSDLDGHLGDGPTIARHDLRAGSHVIDIVARDLDGGETQQQLGVLIEVGCPGDCDRDRSVRINELIRGVGIALGQSVLDICRVFDLNGDLSVAINELIRAVRAALDGCPAPATATPTPSDTPTFTPFPTSTPAPPTSTAPATATPPSTSTSEPTQPPTSTATQSPSATATATSPAPVGSATATRTPTATSMATDTQAPTVTNTVATPPTNTPAPHPPPATATATPTATSSPSLPGAPLITSLTCEGVAPCNVSEGVPFEMRFSYRDDELDVDSYALAGLEEDGFESFLVGQIFPTSAEGEVALQLTAFCANPNCTITYSLTLFDQAFNGSPTVEIQVHVSTPERVRYSTTGPLNNPIGA